MKRLLKLPTLLCLVLALDQAHAVPSFSRQTGLSCAVCHSNPPQLTAFGRDFKIKSYVLSDMTDLLNVDNNKDLLLSEYIPRSLEVELSDTVFQSKVPGTQNDTAGFPQALSLLIAGGFASHFGGLAHLTYTHADEHFGFDDVDPRYAHHGILAGKDWLDGTFAAGGGTTAANHLHSFKLDSTYHWTNKYNLTGALFSITGNTDPLLYAPAPLTGSNNGSPNTSGYIVRFGSWPVQNIVIDANYTGYRTFNGASKNYDGANRSASDNNSAYVALQLNFQEKPCRGLSKKKQSRKT